MSRMKRCALLTLLSIALAACAVLAQEPGPPPGGMPFPPFGGMGGMMGGPGGGGDLQLVSNASVQKEINLTTKQKSQLRSVEESANAGRREVFASAREEGFDPGAIGEQMKAIVKEQESKVGRILDKKQKTRIDQIKLQRDGLLAVARSEVASKLKITAPQSKQIKKIVESMNKEIAAALPAPPGGFGGPPGGFPGAGGPPGGFPPGSGGPPGDGGDTPKKKDANRQTGGNGENGNNPPDFGGPGGGPPAGVDFEAFREKMEQGFQAMKKIRESAAKQVEALLTAPQKAAWEKLIGEPFDLSTLQQGPRGPGGPGGPGRPPEKGAKKDAGKDQ